MIIWLIGLTTEIEHLILLEHSDKDRGIHLFFTSQREIIKMLKVTNIDLFTQKSSLPTYPMVQLEPRDVFIGRILS